MTVSDIKEKSFFVFLEINDIFFMKPKRIFKVKKRNGIDLLNLINDYIFCDGLLFNLYFVHHTIFSVSLFKHPLWVLFFLNSSQLVTNKFNTYSL